MAKRMVRARAAAATAPIVRPAAARRRLSRFRPPRSSQPRVSDSKIVTARATIRHTPLPAIE